MPLTNYIDKTRSIVRVLAIEDNPGDLRLVREYLGNAVLGRYQISSAGSMSSRMTRTSAGLSWLPLTGKKGGIYPGNTSL